MQLMPPIIPSHQSLFQVYLQVLLLLKEKQLHLVTLLLLTQGQTLIVEPFNPQSLTAQALKYMKPLRMEVFNLTRTLTLALL